MKDGNADLAVLVNVGVPDLCEDPELGRLEGILFGKVEVALEEPALVQRIGRTDYHHLDTKVSRSNKVSLNSDPD